MDYLPGMDGVYDMLFAHLLILTEEEGEERVEIPIGQFCVQILGIWVQLWLEASHVEGRDLRSCEVGRSWILGRHVLHGLSLRRVQEGVHHILKLLRVRLHLLDLCLH